MKLAVASMQELEFETAPPPQRPSTITVISLLVVLAAVLSYLCSYAMANALVKAEVFKPWPHDHDPRPTWFIVGFLVLISLFTGVGAAVRFVSARHMKQIEEMEEDN